MQAFLPPMGYARACKTCIAKIEEGKTITRNVLEAKAERAWVPGTVRRVEVSGYAYLTNLPVKVGTWVWLPASWLDELKGQRGAWRGRVTSLISNYAGECKWIISICKESEIPKEPGTEVA